MKIKRKVSEKDEISKDEEFTRPDLPLKHGPKPKVFVTNGTDSQNTALLEGIAIIQKENPEATIGILVRNNEYMKRIEDIFVKAKVNFQFIKSPSKTDDVSKIGTHHEPGIKLTTLHTAKGLDIKYVMITDLVDPLTKERLGED